MRGTKGKLLCIWSPVLHGVGCSTVACSMGFAIQHFSGKRILIVNKSNSTSHMEKYMSKDIEIKYSMDNLKIFNTGIRTEHIMTYATQVNKDLHMIAGSRFGRGITKEGNDFDRLFLEKALEGFDVVIVDVDTGVREENKLLLESADRIVAVLTPNEIVMDELQQCPGLNAVHEYFSCDRTICVINKLYEGWDSRRVTGRYSSKYSKDVVFGLNYDGEVLNSCCTDRNFYSYLAREIKRDKSEFVKQLSELSDFVISELSMEYSIGEEGGKDRGLIRRLLQSSLF